MYALRSAMYSVNNNTIVVPQIHMDRLLHIMQCGEKKAMRIIIVSASNQNEGHRARGIITIHKHMYIYIYKPI